MPRSKPRLFLSLLLPYLVTVPPLVAAGYMFARRALDQVAVEVASVAALQQARGVAARLPPDLPTAALAAWCRDEVGGGATRLTVIAADGRVLCDSEADPSGMVNHQQRAEVAAALRSGTGIDRRESATVHYQLIYAAVRVGEGPGVRVVRIAIPAHLLAVPERHLDWLVLLTMLFAVAAVMVPALYVLNRIARRLQRMIGFSHAVAAGDFSARLPAARPDELGALEEDLDRMSESLRRRFRGLEEEANKVQAILRAMIEGVIVISPAGEVILINRRAQEIFGLTSGADYQGSRLIELCRDPELRDLLQATVESGPGTTHGREITLGGAGGHSLAVSVASLADGAGRAVAYVLVFHDITQLKKLETVRLDFVANVSHELRTPLTAIRGYAETLLGGALEDRRLARQFVSVIDRHSERLSRLVDDLLTLSDLELGKTGLKKYAVPIERLVDGVLEVLGERAGRGKVTLAKEIPADLPPLLGDPDRLQQVLVNLTDNAVKYTPAGGRVTIAARLAANGPRPVVEVAVHDTGLGIPAGDLPRLTERFYRADKVRSRELGGTGLGLAIVKHIVQAHGGQLQITSEVNVGTTVRFSVPGWVPVNDT